MASHQAAPKPEKIERKGALLPHAAAPKAPERAPGRSWHPHELRRAPAQRRHLAQAAAEQREAADRHCHGCNPGLQTERLPPVARVLTAADRAPPHPARRDNKSHWQRVPGRLAGAGPGAKLKAGRRGHGIKLGWGPGAGLKIPGHSGHNMGRSVWEAGALQCDLATWLLPHSTVR